MQNNRLAGQAVTGMQRQKESRTADGNLEKAKVVGFFPPKNLEKFCQEMSTVEVS